MTMQVDNISSPTTEARSPASNQLTGDAFLTLLVAQLRSQSPFEPMNPAEFVAQLVQFNTLDQLIRIRLALEAGNPVPASRVADNPASTPFHSR